MIPVAVKLPLTVEEAVDRYPFSVDGPDTARVLLQLLLRILWSLVELCLKRRG